MAAELPPGLSIVPEVIAGVTEERLIAECEEAGWEYALKRGTRQYGRTYPFRGGPLGRAPPLPEGLREIFREVRGAFPELRMEADQCIVNRYLPGEGISHHTDDRRLFGPDILVLSLGSDVTMEFRPPGGGPEVPIRIPRRSAYLMSGEARNSWQHSLPARKKDGKEVRGTRISITYRSLPS
jgi:alkylated DNA repair dioxygenase AlkB